MSRPGLYLKLMILVTATVTVVSCGKGDRAPRATAFPDSIVDDEIIAFVNTLPVTARELRVFTTVYAPVNLDSLRDPHFNLELLDGMVDRTVLWQEAKALGLEVSDSTSNWFIRRFAQSMGGDEQLNASLAELNITRAEMDQMIRRDLLVRTLIEQEVTAEITVTDADCRAYFDANPSEFAPHDSVRAQHIFVRAPKESSEAEREAKREKISEARARIQNGVDFAVVASDVSEGPRAPNGGDIGFFAHRDMVPAFSDAAFALEVGEVSDIVETDFGYHLIKVTDRRKGVARSFDEVREDLKRQLQSRAATTAIENHLQRLRAVAIIDLNFEHEH